MSASMSLARVGCIATAAKTRSSAWEASTAQRAAVMSSATVTTLPTPARCARSMIAARCAAVSAPHASTWVCASTTGTLNGFGSGGSSFLLTLRSAAFSRSDRGEVRTGLGKSGVEFAEQRFRLGRWASHLDRCRGPLGLLCRIVVGQDRVLLVGDIEVLDL